MINYELENELKPILSTHERLVWTGKPKTGIIFRKSDVFLIPFSLLWGGFAFFWETTVIATGAPFFFMLWGIPFVLMGLYITVGRFFLDAKKRANTVYGITTDRIIIKTGIFSSEIKSLNIRTLSDITISQNADNSGTITFGPTDAKSAMVEGMDWPGIKQPPKFELIEGVQNIYEKIVALQREAYKIN